MATGDPVDWTRYYAAQNDVGYGEYKSNDYIAKGQTGQTAASPKTGDNVNSPAHYTAGVIEAIDYLRDNMPWEAFVGGLEWNIKKYLHRWRYKGSPVNDLKKARWYLDKLIEQLDAPTTNTAVPY